MRGRKKRQSLLSIIFSCSMAEHRTVLPPREYLWYVVVRSARSSIGAVGGDGTTRWRRPGTDDARRRVRLTISGISASSGVRCYKTDRGRGSRSVAERAARRIDVRRSFVRFDYARVSRRRTLVLLCIILRTVGHERCVLCVFPAKERRADWLSVPQRPNMSMKVSVDEECRWDSRFI